MRYSSDALLLTFWTAYQKLPCLRQRDVGGGNAQWQAAIFRMQSCEVAVLWHDCHSAFQPLPCILDCSRLVLNYDKVLQPGQVVVVMSKGQKARPLQVEHFTVGDCCVLAGPSALLEGVRRLRPGADHITDVPLPF